jgi:anti-anti-sigma factor
MNILSVTPINDHILFKVSGDILMENSKDFYNGIMNSISEKNKFRFVSFDFGKVQFMDSSGIGSLIKLTSDLQKEKCGVNIYNLNKNLTAVFHLSGINSIIKIHTLKEFVAQYPDFDPEKEKI